ncbi:MAG: hypothetical protein LBR54_03445, partial [Oscillospiraceae bacterium]|nr:hypothetical protein [Oscillospiraceae bacterium]
MYNMYKKILAAVITLALLPAVLSSFTAKAADLPVHTLIGYWENWYTNPTMKLSEVDEGWDVIIASFMLTDASNSTCVFTPDPSLYPDPDSFADDVKFCQERGQKVLVSFG